MSNDHATLQYAVTHWRGPHPQVGNYDLIESYQGFQAERDQSAILCEIL